MNEKVIKNNINEMKPKYKNEHEGYEYNKYEVTKRSEFDQAYVCFYEVMPGCATYPKHYHSYNTECFYIISGEGEIELKDSVMKVKDGDVVVFPKGEAGIHKIINTSLNEKIIYIDFDTTNSPDIVHYVDSNKIGVIEHNIASNFYRVGDTLDYFEGE